MKNFFYSAKKIIRVALLIFVVISVGYLIAKESSSPLKNSSQKTENTPAPATSTRAAADHVTAYYFHGNFRCTSCKKIEAYSEAAIKEGFNKELSDGKLDFQIINVEQPENRHFIKDYSLVSKALVLVLKEKEMPIRSKNLDLVWQLLGSRDNFIRYVQSETRSFLNEVKK